jgi:hypothetical protein
MEREVHGDRDAPQVLTLGEPSEPPPEWDPAGPAAAIAEAASKQVVVGPEAATWHYRDKVRVERR